MNVNTEYFILTYSYEITY